MVRALLLLVTVVSLAAAIVFSGCRGGGGPAAAGSDAASQGLLDDRAGGVYVALGDSLAAGVGASEPERGYVGQLRAMVEERLQGGLDVENLAVPGATTQSLIDGQLEQAESLLRQGDVRLVTIDIGGNDYAALFGNEACLEETPSPDCPLASVLGPVEARLDEIFRRLRDAGPDVPVVVMTYPNLFSGSGHPFEVPAENALSGLNDVIRDVAGRYDVAVADPAAAFQGKSLEYTHIGDVQQDFHPNDAGYAAIARAFLEVLFPSP